MKYKILFVDDEQFFLDSMRNRLRKSAREWDLDFADNVDSALRKTDTTDYDAIVSDIRMPGKTGLEFLEILKSSPHTRDIPVIILTGSGDLELKRQAIGLGATDLLNKPVVQEDLLVRLKNVLQLKSHQDALKAQNELLERRVSERTRELEISRISLVWRLAKAGEFRDQETGEHIVRVGSYCRKIAEVMGKEQEFIDAITLVSPLHDIGKIGIPDNILLKPGRLNEEEWERMKYHTVIGHKILMQPPRGIHHLLGGKQKTSTDDSQLIEMAANIAVAHHEQWNGKGYPYGLKEKQIPLPARITALADIYDALRSERPYKTPFSEEKTRELIVAKAGDHLDPEVVEAFQVAALDFQQIHDDLKD